MTMFAYSGVEAITYIAGEVQNPEKNILKAIIWAIIVVVIVYVGLAIAVICLSPINILNPNSKGQPVM